ncbi:MAG: hypothetical protein PUJ82_15890 [Spirochaetales bacterium]|nr:hypothetical protein [Spirochaetales bacterium]MDD7612391.1 hypothetical protein [Spirochaetales bacterium]
MIKFETDLYNTLSYDWNYPVYDEEKNIIAEKLEQQFTNSNTAMSSIVISAPERISITLDENLIIPFVIFSYLSPSRVNKYLRTCGYLMAYVKDADGNEICCVEIFNPKMNGEILPLQYLPAEEDENLSDEEIENSKIHTIEYLTVNLASYIKLPLKNGIYEIYCKQYNLESNHIKISINRKHAFLQWIMNRFRHE